MSMRGTGETAWETGVALCVKPLLVKTLAHVLTRMLQECKEGEKMAHTCTGPALY